VSNLARTDDELGRKLFARLFLRFEKARKTDRTIHVIDMWSVGFSLRLHGSKLTVNQGQQGRLLEIALVSKHKPQDGDDRAEPWRATICRSADGTRVALTPGPEGTLDEIIEEVVRTVLSKTAPQN
jgi:hypothetical protein